MSVTTPMAVSAGVTIDALMATLLVALLTMLMADPLAALTVAEVAGQSVSIAVTMLSKTLVMMNAVRTAVSLSKLVVVYLVAQPATHMCMEIAASSAVMVDMTRMHHTAPTLPHRSLLYLLAI